MLMMRRQLLQQLNGDIAGGGIEEPPACQVPRIPMYQHVPDEELE